MSVRRTRQPRGDTGATGAAGTTISYACLADEETSGTGTGSLATGSWVTRVLNTERSDTDGIVALSSNQFVLSAGTYIIEASAPGMGAGAHQARLYNVTDTSTILVGTSEKATSETFTTRSLVAGKFTIAAGKSLELQHWLTLNADGNNGGQGVNTGEVEVFALVELWKMG